MPYATSTFLLNVPDLRRRTGVVILVVGVHLLVLLAVIGQIDAIPAATKELSVALLSSPEVKPGKQVTAPQVALDSPAESRKRPVPLPQQSDSVQSTPLSETDSPAPVAAIPATAPEVRPVEPVVADVEPDYRASYLHNPIPVYPLSARRMGLQGRVVLNVEVLAEGVCGQVSIHQSSGYAMLDNSALQTVRAWRFVPARHAGQSVTQWFKIPIQFSLKDSEA